MANQQLKNLRVLDLTSVVVGPTCTWRLAQYGAEVIKIEAPEGDLMRGLGGVSPTGQHSGTYLHLNRGKRNVCLDLKKPGAKDIIEKLIEWCDVVVANMRPKALERLGLDAGAILARHPQKIHCLITGYGTDGPYSGLPTYDSVVQGVSGIGGLFLERDGAPAYVPMVICDHVVGEIAAGAILAAVIQRDGGGGGSSLEIPMFETMAAFVLQEHLAQESFDPPVGTIGDKRLLNPQNKPLRTADGWISVTINTDPQVRAFLKAVGRDNLLDDERFSSVAARAKNVKEWFEVRGAALSDKTTSEWLSIFRSADIAAMPCHTLETLRVDPHLVEVGLIVHEEHPTEGKISVIRSTIRTQDGYPSAGAYAQPKGWETRQVLEEIGIDGHTIDGLVSSGAAIGSR
jgi:crotonobetainyl-CoA:carnitine CoA-transferase CaiB-like acyl-CoA transferase